MKNWMALAFLVIYFTGPYSLFAQWIEHNHVRAISLGLALESEMQ